MAKDEIRREIKNDIKSLAISLSFIEYRITFAIKDQIEHNESMKIITSQNNISNGASIGMKNSKLFVINSLNRQSV